MDLESFKEAFYTGMGSCRGQCECGVQFYNSDGGYNFDEGELEELEKIPDSRDIDCSVAFVEFEGIEYVYQCDCWEKKAMQIMQFIDDHSHGIAEYLALEKVRMQAQVDNMPTMEEK